MAPRQPRPSRAARSGGWPLLAVLGAGIIALATTWFTLAGPLSDSGEPEPTRYTEALVGAHERVNPLFAHLNDVDRDIASLVFSGLSRLGPDGQIFPDLADSWEVSADGTVFTFHLRPGVLWHTGAPFTSEDVLFTYKLLADPDLQSDPGQSALWRQVKCSAPNDLTVECKVPEPFAPFLSFTTVGILPKLVLEGADATALFDHAFNQNPIGTGPYRLAQMDETRAVLKANAGYHLGAPQIDEIEFRFYPDTASASAGLSRGDVQGLLLGPGAIQSDFDTLTATDGLKAYTANRSAYTVLYLNNSQPPLNNHSVRAAIAQALDMDSLIAALLGGRAVRADSPIVPGTWAANPDLEPYPHDAEAARELLDKAGWLLPDGSDVRRRQGVELRVALMTDRDSGRSALAQEISRQLAEVGIAATVVNQDSTDLIRDYLIPRDYQAALYGLDLGPDPDPYPAWHSSQISDNGRNLAAFANKEADDILEKARQTTNLDRRQALYYTFQQIFHDEIPSVILYYPVYTYFVSDRVKGLELGTLFDTGSRFLNTYEWTIEKAEDIGQP